MIKLGIVGNGFVGKASKLLKNDNVAIISYDINPNLCEPLGTSLLDIGKCDIIFVSVPTPMNKDGSVYLNIVESVVNDINNVKNEDSFIVIRSTCPPGTSKRLGTYFMPEFLTELNFENDFINCELWIFGLNDSDKDELFKSKITYLFEQAYDHNKIKHKNIKFVSSSEAEMIKYFRNTYLTTKVSFCNEMYRYCEKTGIDYNTVKNLACSDKRIGLSHTNVPGSDGLFGYGGTCFPKDINGLRFEFQKNNVKSYILDAVIQRNEECDRSQKDWNNNVGRSVV